MAHEAEDARGGHPLSCDRSVGRGDGWEDIFDAIPDMVCVLDSEARITRCNRSLCDRLKLTPDRIMRARCQEVLNAAGAIFSRDLFDVAGKKVMPQRNPSDLEIGDFRFSVNSIPLSNAAGDAIGSILIFHDITDLTKSNEKVIQDRKMEAVGRLAGEIAHEINNPLLYIGNYLYLLSEELPPDFDKGEYIEKIQGGVDKLTAFTRDLVDFSRPMGDEFLPVDVQSMLGSALETLTDGLRGKQIEVMKRFDCGGERVLGSGEKLRKVFVNLIQNAIDAMDQGGAVTITTDCSDRLVTVIFEDTGVGITEENLHRIFDPFFTTRTGPAKKGAGLGLAVCYNIVRRHGGGITASSRAGGGTKITVTLPASTQRS